MNLKVEDGSLNYACQVVEIDKVFPIEGKDRIQTTLINGNQIIISKDVKPGDVCLYFVSGTRLAEDYCYENNLYDSHELNKDTSKKGYLSPQKRRVRPLKLGGIISDGFLMPLNSLNYLLGTSRIDDLRPGDTFTHINDKIVCEKYFVPVRNANPGGSAPKTEKIRLVDILIPGQFRFHYETPHIGKHSERLNGGKKAVVTYKVHGSSIILSRVKILRKLTLIDKIAKFFGAKVVETEYGNIYSSGKPKSGLPKGIDSKWVNKGPDFYSMNIWEQAYQDFKYALEDGITLYGELVGNHIQGGYDYTRLIPDDRNYGFLVYRITRTNESGIVDEFSWEQIENYCAKYALTPVPFLEEIIGGEDILPQLAEKYLDKKCIYCKNDVWAEGVCIRINNEIYKFKSKNFLLMEDKQLEQEVNNIEEQ